MELSKLSLLVNANVPIIALESPTAERNSILGYILHDCCKPIEIPCYFWNIGQQVIKEVASADNGSGITLKPYENFQPQADSRLEVLDHVINCEHSGIWIIKDLHPWLGGSDVSHQMVGHVENAFHELLIPKTIFGNVLIKRIILLGQNIQLVPQLWDLIPLVEDPLPTATQISEEIDRYLSGIQKRFNKAGSKQKVKIDLSPEDKEGLVKAASGLPIESIRSGLRLIVREHFCIDELSAERLDEYKAEKLKHLNLEVLSKMDIPTFGGLYLLKADIEQTAKLFTPRARELNLPMPKGFLLTGMPGTGKTFAAKVVAKTWKMRLISVDWGSIYGGIVGQSESNLRRLLKLAEACSPCILFFDEIEKAFAGNETSASDGGLSQRLGNKILTWMQEKTSPVFIIGACNRIDKLPLELTRIGRFDKIYSVGLPTLTERQQILDLHLAKYSSELFSETPPETRLIASESELFSGAELAGMVDQAAIAAFTEDSLISTPSLLRQRRLIKPLAERNSARLEEMQTWASQYGQPASSLN